mmetsp:Transcript_5062/g.14989  ORF Transcript_5062/g.14989 Transcript_5062/m.14989 type:complete len:96 (+) Transcript_5062:1364-1651(+)
MQRIIFFRSSLPTSCLCRQSSDAGDVRMFQCMIFAGRLMPSMTDSTLQVTIFVKTPIDKLAPSKYTLVIAGIVNADPITACLARRLFSQLCFCLT